GTFTTTLASSNIMDILASPYSQDLASSLIIDALLATGITVELAFLYGLSSKRWAKRKISD
ncbi:MAG: hypothetical protein ACFFEA_08290, partial [Candidatus Thorarchaeota archaeon]